VDDEQIDIGPCWSVIHIVRRAVISTVQ
jgi:hypothetical protein